MRNDRYLQDETLVRTFLDDAFERPVDEVGRRRHERVIRRAAVALCEDEEAPRAPVAVSTTGEGKASPTAADDGHRPAAGLARRSTSAAARQQWAAVAAALLLTVASSSGVAAAASSKAMPGELLYPVKQLVERARVAATADELTTAELSLRFAERRLDELVALAEEGRALGHVAGLWEAFERHLETAEVLGGSVFAGDVAQLRQRADELRQTIGEAVADEQAGEDPPVAEPDETRSSRQPSTRVRPSPGRSRVAPPAAREEIAAVPSTELPGESDRSHGPGSTAARSTGSTRSAPSDTPAAPSRSPSSPSPTPSPSPEPETGGPAGEEEAAAPDPPDEVTEDTGDAQPGPSPDRDDRLAPHPSPDGDDTDRPDASPDGGDTRWTDPFPDDDATDDQKPSREERGPAHEDDGSEGGDLAPDDVADTAPQEGGVGWADSPKHPGT